MKNITLIKPVVLRSALNDMTVSQREIAVDLLTNRKFLLPMQMDYGSSKTRRTAANFQNSTCMDQKQSAITASLWIFRMYL